MFKKILSNWRSGLTVALVSIPLSVSLAMASGATPVEGIITAVVAGIIGAILGGSNFNIIGPTGALTGITGSFVIAHGAGSLPLLTTFVGVIIIIAFLLKVERYLIFIPSSVIHGFTLGISVILILGQFNFAVGLNKLAPKANVIENLYYSFQHIQNIDLITIISFLVYLLFLILFRKIKPGFPGAIILAPLAILIGYLSKAHILNFNIFTLGDKFNNMTMGLAFHFTFDYNKQIIFTALTISFIAIIETLLSAKIGDTMTHTKHNPRKEILSLGVANIASGIFGGIPATAALARTSLNIRSGANHRSSGIINGVFIAIISVFLLGQFTYIPMAAIAAILVDTAIKMVDPKHYTRFRKFDRQSYYISFAVAFVTIIEDPIVGIVLGVTISFFIFADKTSRGLFELSLNNESGIVKTISGDRLTQIKEDATVLLYSIRGNLLYINSTSHLSRFESEMFDNYKYVILRLREVYMMDIDGVEALDEMIHILYSKGITVMITSASEEVRNKLRRMSKEYIFMENHGLVFDKTRYALNKIGIPLDKKL